MIYYTLSKLGKAWLDDEAPNPSKYRSVLAGLAELVSETNGDVPYGVIQIAHVANTTEEVTAAGLDYLIKNGYVSASSPPRPAKAERLRLPTIQELAAAEERRLQSQQQYMQSDKGKAAVSRYWHGEKGSNVRKAFWSSEKGKLAQRRWRLKRRMQELIAARDTHPEAKAKINQLVEKVKAEMIEIGE